jgi:hypothetical protein
LTLFAELSSLNSLAELSSLNSLRSIQVNAAGQSLDSFVDPIIHVVQRVVLNTPSGEVQVLECAGKLLNTLITALGPELQVCDIFSALLSAFFAFPPLFALSVVFLS